MAFKARISEGPTLYFSNMVLANIEQDVGVGIRISFICPRRDQTTTVILVFGSLKCGVIMGIILQISQMLSTENFSQMRNFMDLFNEQSREID